MIKYFAAVLTLSFSLTAFAGGDQLDELAERLTHQEEFIFISLENKTSAEEAAKVKNEVDNHVDIYLAADSSEARARHALKRVVFLRTKLVRYFSPSELADLQLNIALITAFGTVKAASE